MNIASEPSALRGHSVLGPVAIKLDTILVRIAQIKRFADAMVARAVERDFRLDHPVQRVGKRRARGIKNGGMKQSGGARRGRVAAFAFPGVQPI